MKRIFLLLSMMLLLVATALKAQTIEDGWPADSSTITFSDTSLTDSFIIWHTLSYCIINIDTTNTHLWRIGKTHKPFFADSTDTTVAIMTDTTNPYPINANDWFIFKIKPYQFNMTIDFWHKYQTESGKDGGIVEFSLDSGITWQNVMGDCYGSFTPSIYLENFYSKNDTLTNGEPAFTGTSKGWQYSRLQFFVFEPIRLTGGSGCNWDNIDELYLRFRFESDSVADSLAGWIIDSIKIEADKYSYVRSIRRTLDQQIYPNPSTSGVFNFPALNVEKNCTLEITNAIGQTIIKTPYQHKVDLSTYPKGVYFYKVVNETEYFSGHLVFR